MSTPAEAAETSCLNHVIWLPLRQARSEHYVAGGRMCTTVAPGGMLVFPAGAAMSGKWLDPIMSVGVQIAPDLLSRAAEGDQAAGRFELKAGYRSEGDPFIIQLIRSLRADLVDGVTGGRLYGESLGTALAAHLLRKHAAHPQPIRGPRGGLGPHRLKRVTEYIDARLDQDLSLPDLAGVVGLNLGHFARAFKQSTHLTPHQYVMSRRIERACELLRDPAISIVEIALRCGYSSQSTFSTAFHRLKGIAPREYRNSLR